MAQKISVAEFEKQKEDYTKKALKELNEQLKSRAEAHNTFRTEDEEDNDDDDDDVFFPSESRSFENYVHRGPVSRKKQSQDHDFQVINEISRLNKKIMHLKQQLCSEEQKNHYMTIELSEKSVKLEEYANLIENNKKKETETNELIKKMNQRDLDAAKIVKKLEFSAAWSFIFLIFLGFTVLINLVFATGAVDVVWMLWMCFEFVSLFIFNNASLKLTKDATKILESSAIQPFLVNQLNLKTK